MRARASHESTGTAVLWLRVAGGDTHLLFLSLVVDDLVVDRKLSLSPFTFPTIRRFFRRFCSWKTDRSRSAVSIIFEPFFLFCRAYLLFAPHVFDDPIAKRKPSLSPFSFPYFQAFLQAFLLPET